MKGSTQTSPSRESGAGPLKAVAVALFVVDAVLIALERYATGKVMIPELIGALLAPIIVTILIVGVARAFKRARSPRAAAKVAIATMALFALGSCGGLVTAMSATSAAGGDASGAALLAKRSAAEARGVLPKKVDSVTWLRGVTAVGDTLAYWYQLTNMTASELDTGAANAFRAQLVDRACSSGALRGRLLSHGVVVRYHYADSVNTAMTAVDVSEAACSAAR